MAHRRRRTHTALFDRCVKDVARSGTAVNPDAVCQAELGTRALLRPRRANRRRRRINPRVFVIRAQRSGHAELTYTGSKFERGGIAVKFPTRALASTWLRYLRNQFSRELERYRLRVATL